MTSSTDTTSTCRCGNNFLYNVLAVSQSDCSSSCSGDSSEVCGGQDRINVYCNSKKVACLNSITSLPTPTTCSGGGLLGDWKNCGSCGKSCNGGNSSVCSGMDGGGRCLEAGPNFTIAYTITNVVVPTSVATIISHNS